MVLDYADAAVRAGQHDRVTGHLEALAAREPLDERLPARLMRILAATGRQAAALRVYAEVAGRLDAELGISPGPELAAAHLEVLRQQVPHAAARPAPPGPLVPRQLPPAVPGFAGRAAELAVLARCWTGHGARGHGGDLGDRRHRRRGQDRAGGALGAPGRRRFPDGQLYVNLHGFGPPAPP